MNEPGFSYKDRLEKARQESAAKKTAAASSVAKDIVGRRKEIKKRAKQVLLSLSLANHIDPLWDWIFGIALSFAILKDIVDLVGLGSLPVVGTLITFFASSVIFFALLLAGSGAKNKTKGYLKKYGTLAIGTMIEFVFGIDFLPIETCVVVLTYVFVLQERQEEAMEKEAEKNQQAEMESQESFA